ncbi:hypothetical protein X801_03656, partial [Opisthorchis viverrini]
CRGIVRVPYQTIEGSAKGGGKDYEDAIGYLEFQNDQTEATIRVRVVDDNDYEKSEFFFVQLGEPLLVDKDAPKHVAKGLVFIIHGVLYYELGKLMILTSMCFPLIACRVTVTAGRNADSSRIIMDRKWRKMEELNVVNLLHTPDVTSPGDVTLETKENLTHVFGDLHTQLRSSLINHFGGPVTYVNQFIIMYVQGVNTTIPRYLTAQQSLLSRFTNRRPTIPSTPEKVASPDAGKQLALPETQETGRRTSQGLIDTGKPRLVYYPANLSSENTVDRLVKQGKWALVVGTSSWKEQFVEAVTVSAGGDGEGADLEEEKLPSCMDYVMHFLTVFWKVLFAFVPPT